MEILQLGTQISGCSDAQIALYDRDILVAASTLRLQIPFRTVVLFLQGVIHLAQYVQPGFPVSLYIPACR